MPYELPNMIMMHIILLLCGGSLFYRMIYEMRYVIMILMYE
jgi:hypothetical protein